MAVEQASLSGVSVVGGDAAVYRREPAARPRPQTKITAGPEIPISLAAYERAFEAKVRWEAGRHDGSDELDFPPRYRLDEDGGLTTDYELVPLPRVGTVYTEVTVHIPVPGLRTPYSLVIVELDDVEYGALVKVTGVEAGTVRIGDRGRLTLRRVAMRSGVPDYGYSFEPYEPACATNRPSGLGCGVKSVAVVGAGMTAFGEHFALGIKDLLPMAFAECAASVDKGVNKSEIRCGMVRCDGNP